MNEHKTKKRKIIQIVCFQKPYHDNPYFGFLTDDGQVWHEEKIGLLGRIDVSKIEQWSEESEAKARTQREK